MANQTARGKLPGVASAGSDGYPSCRHARYRLCHAFQRAVQRWKITFFLDLQRSNLPTSANVPKCQHKKATCFLSVTVAMVFRLLVSDRCSAVVAASSGQDRTTWRDTAHLSRHGIAVVV